MVFNVGKSNYIILYNIKFYKYDSYFNKLNDLVHNLVFIYNLKWKRNAILLLTYYGTNKVKCIIIIIINNG